MTNVTQQISRRALLGGAVSTGVGLTVLTGKARASAGAPRLRLASVGVGGMGAADLKQISTHSAVDVVGLCDVDAGRLKAAHQLHPKAKTFADWREMFSTLGDQVDAVHVATPDHTHAPVAMSAILKGKHVYCQKPLTHDVLEARALREAAQQHNVVTQMGIQVHSDARYQTAVQLVQSGAIGKVREAHSWSGKTWGYDGPTPKQAPVPKHLSWDLWLGTAPWRDYARDHYHPGNWRKWVDFGCGTMGDMSIHILDPVFGALQLSAPQAVTSHSPGTPPAQSFAMKNKVVYEIAPTPFTTDNFKLTWSDGGIFPDTNEWPVEELPSQGSMFVGEKGFVLLPHVGMPQLLPKEQFANHKVQPAPGENHWHQWVKACLGDGHAWANFSYSGPLTELVLLGVVANRHPGQRLEWNDKKGEITNFEPAARLLKRDYRDGWSVKGLG